MTPEKPASVHYLQLYLAVRLLALVWQKSTPADFKGFEPPLPESWAASDNAKGKILEYLVSEVEALPADTSTDGIYNACMRAIMRQGADAGASEDKQKEWLGLKRSLADELFASINRPPDDEV